MRSKSLRPVLETSIVDGCIIRYCNSGFEEILEVLKELEIRGIEVCFSLFLISQEEEAYIKEHLNIKVCHMQSPEMHLNIIEKNESSVYEAVCYLAQLGHRKIGGIQRKNVWK